MSRRRSRRKKIIVEHRVERRRFVRIGAMVQDRHPRSCVVGGLTVDYYRCFLAQRTQSYLTVRKTTITVLHDTPSTALRADMDSYALCAIRPRPFPYEFIYNFCLTHASMFTPAQREIIELYYQEGYTERQIAHYLDITHQAVHDRVKKVRKRLAILAKYGGTIDSTDAKTKRIRL